MKCQMKSIMHFKMDDSKDTKMNVKMDAMLDINIYMRMTNDGRAWKNGISLYGVMDKLIE